MSREWIAEAKSSTQSPRREDTQWVVTYEIWCIHSNKTRYKVSISAESSRITPFLSTAPIPQLPETRDGYLRGQYREQQGGGDGFSAESLSHLISFPAAISDDLRRVLLLDTVVCVHSGTNSSPDLYTHSLCSLNLGLADNGRHTPFRTDLGFPRHYEPFFTATFNPQGKYIALVHESWSRAVKQGHECGDLWCLRIFRDETFGTSPTASFICTTITQFFAVPEVGMLSPHRGIVFHPTLPRIAFPQTVDGLAQTYIWDFENPVKLYSLASSGRNPFPVHDPPLIDPHYSDDGNYISGTDAPIEFGRKMESRVFCSPFVIKVPDSHLLTNPTEEDNDSIVPRIQSNPLQNPESIREAIHELSRRPKPIVQHSNMFSINKDCEGVVHISQLHQLQKQGAIVLRTLDSEGKASAETLHRLPDYVARNSTASLVDDTGTDNGDKSGNKPSNFIKLVLNRPRKRFYDCKDLGQISLPAIIEREKQSIPSFWKTWHTRRSEFQLEDEFARKVSLLEGAGGIDSRTNSAQS